MALAVAFIFHREWLMGDVFVGNFDRLDGGSLPVRTFEVHSLQQSGRIPAWCDDAFMGLNFRAHGAVHGGWSVLTWIFAHLPARDFLPFAALVCAGLLGLAILGAYLALASLGARTLSATVGALCYGCSVLVGLRIAQGEGFALNLVLLPWLYWVAAGAGDRAPVATLTLYAVLVYSLLENSFLQETAYAGLGLGLFVLVDARRRRSWRPVALLVAATLCAVVAAAPRILEVQRELGLLQRTPHGLTGESMSFASIYAQQNLTSREFLRLLADGIFGRSPAEASDLGNNINLNEGFQVYSSTFASLLLLGALSLVLVRGRKSSRTEPAIPRPYVLYAAIMVGVISAAVLTRTGLHLLYWLFLGIDFSHGRLVAAALFPMAMLVADGLERVRPRQGSLGVRQRAVCLLVAAPAAAVAFWGLHRLTDRAYDPVRLDLAAPLAYQLRAVGDLALGRSPPLEIPHGGIARRIAPRTIALAWTALHTGAVEVAMNRDGGPFAVIGTATDNRYTVGDIDPHARYGFQLRVRQGARTSPYGAEFFASPYEPGIDFNRIAPAAKGPTTWLLSREVLYLAAALVAFAGWLAACRIARGHPRLREGLVQFLAALIVIEAVSGAEYRLNGPETRTFPHPFFKDNLFTSPAGTLVPPNAEERAALQARLDRDRYRTVLLEPGDQFYSVSLHVPVAWNLRVPQGGWAGVPKRLAALAWPGGVVSMRRLIFRPGTDLPWELLGDLNVKYAVLVDTDFYFNRWYPRLTPQELAGLQVTENPRPVLPRTFFASRTKPIENFQTRRDFPVPMPANPLRESYVEGMPEARDWSTAGRIEAHYDGDRITVQVTAEPQERFLVLNELYHPDWRAATSGGRALRIYPVNTVMRGVEIPPGTTEIDLRFQPRFGGVWPLTAAAAGVCTLILACLVARRRTRAAGTAKGL